MKRRADGEEIEFEAEPTPKQNEYPTVYPTKRWRKSGILDEHGEEIWMENRPPLGFLKFDWHEEEEDDDTDGADAEG